MPATPLAACDATTVTLPDGRVVLSFGGCNYLGLANHPRVVQAVVNATVRFGLSSTASRETTGNAQPHDTLESELAAFLGIEQALLTPDGYLANIVACQGLAAAGCTIALLDGRAHVSMSDAARTAGLEVTFFDHADPASLVRTLEAVRGGRDDRSAGGAVVMTDGIFTADGEPAPVSDYLRALRPTDRLLIDDCHGLGVIGPEGRGSAAHASAADPRIVITSSLAKGLGCAGGIVAGSRVDVYRFAESAAYVCTTPIAPAMAEGTRAALAILQAEPARVDRVGVNARRLRAGLGRLGLLPSPTARTDPGIPIAAFTLGDLQTMRQLEAGLLADGFRVPLIRYPGGPAEAYFRLSVNAEHTPEQIDRLLTAIAARLDSRDSGLSTLRVQTVDPARSRLTG
jgi:8-amino-7-oxononanoate synthase